MNHRQQVAAMHARELAKAKQQLLLKVNQYIQEVRADGGNAEVVPQLQRLISLGSYRLRDVQKCGRLLVTLKSTGLCLCSQRQW